MFRNGSCAWHDSVKALFETFAGYRCKYCSHTRRSSCLGVSFLSCKVVPTSTTVAVVSIPRAATAIDGSPSAPGDDGNTTVQMRGCGQAVQTLAEAQALVASIRDGSLARQETAHELQIMHRRQALTKLSDT
eukprot:s78_g42.t2